MTLSRNDEIVEILGTGEPLALPDKGNTRPVTGFS
jgi:hypothetical protein